jgi:hypothetical protein
METRVNKYNRINKGLMYIMNFSIEILPGILEIQYN